MALKGPNEKFETVESINERQCIQETFNSHRKQKFLLRGEPTPHNVPVWMTNGIQCDRERGDMWMVELDGSRTAKSSNLDTRPIVFIRFSSMIVVIYYNWIIINWVKVIKNKNSGTN